ncbi:RAD52 motif-containing protein 1 isoform X3 [Hyla sarda]|uniref:RAD52 motif-containing protein 1 isoform X3 n=1 Tax=Hyla sarda TaxID=327740 RepID=UPI0024C2D837|nr:RAD52 motif-containing protein 1 isoform X3 [Hyla sarda]
MDPEVVTFTIPIENNKIVFVWNITARLPEGEIYCSMLKVFSQFGPLYSLKLVPNASVAGPGYYAVLKYYSSQSARRAQAACDKKNLFQDTPVKVQICIKQKGFPYKSLELYSQKCQELANYYLGFNGWCKRIIALQNISGLDDNPEMESDPQELGKLRYLCVVEVILPYHGVCSRGVGVAEECLEKQNDSGKVAVEYVSGEEDNVDCLSEEELKGLIQVNDFTWAPMDAGGGEDEEDWAEISFHEDTLIDS